MPIPLRADFDAQRRRAIARGAKDSAQTRRLLALAAIDDGERRTEAAAIGGVTLQIVRDWVMKFNARGPDGLIDRKAPGQPPKLNEAHRAALAIESGPIPAVDGVVRWRLIDLCHWIWEQFRVGIAKQTLSRELRAMGYRKLSARPRHHAQADGAIEDFKKASPRLWTSSRATKRSIRPRSRSGLPTRPVSDKRTRSPGAGPGAVRDPRPRTINARPRPISSAPSVPRTVRARPSSCPAAISRR